MLIVDTPQDLVTYHNNTKSKLIQVVPLLKNSKHHYINNSVIACYVVCDGESYLFPWKHPESVFSEYSIEDIISHTKCYFYEKGVLMYDNVLVNNVFDLELVHYINTTEPLSVEPIDTEQFYQRHYQKYSSVGNLISLATFVKYAKSVIQQANTTTESGLAYYNNMQNVLHMVERNGLCVNLSYFTPIYGQPINLFNKTVYTKYNLFTSTGRPSNRFGGINFAALPKQDDTRKSFVSRYENGCLVEMDFKAYHPHIIAYLCDYDFGDENVYEHLAKHYFDTQKPTKEHTEKAKEYTFNQIYGGINKKYLHIDFFAKTKAYTELLWEQFKEKGCIISGISGRTLHSDYETSTDTQLFNYFIQMTETELNMAYLNRLLQHIDGNNALPVLYTYDAVVFDCKKEYVDDLVSKIMYNTSAKFPISVKVGDNYKEMNPYMYEATTSVYVYN